MSDFFFLGGECMENNWWYDTWRSTESDLEKPVDALMEFIMSNWIWGRAWTQPF